MHCPTYAYESQSTRKVNQHLELSGAALHPGTGFSWVQTVRCAIKSLNRSFCVTPPANATQLRAGLDYEGLGIRGPENELKSFSMNQAYGIYTQEVGLSQNIHNYVKTIPKGGNRVWGRGGVGPSVAPVGSGGRPPPLANVRNYW